MKIRSHNTYYDDVFLFFFFANVKRQSDYPYIIIVLNIYFH